MPDDDLITVWRGDVDLILNAIIPTGQLDDSPSLKAAWNRLGEAVDPPAGTTAQPEPASPSLPDGEYARVEVMGHDQHTGWVTDGTRAGIPVLVVKDWDGRTVAEVPGGSLYRFVPLPTPLKRPEPRRALASRPFGAALDDDYDEPDDGADHDASDYYSTGGPF